MKILTYTLKDGNDGKEYPGYLSEDGKHVISFEMIGINVSDVNDLIDRYSLEELLCEKAEREKQVSLKDAVPLEKVRLLSPVPRPKQDVICLGINYAAHAEESARYKKEAFEREKVYPIYFSKRVNEAVADGMPVDSHRDMFENLDYEVELAVVTGRTKKDTGKCCRVAKDRVSEHVFGYTILNDMSAREIQTRHKQWYFGKGLDEFTPMGPWIVTADEIAYPPALEIKSYVNGQLRQNSRTDMLINDIDYIIWELTQGMTLLPGTIISTGTPAGVGMGMIPPEFLKPGDEVRCVIEGIGEITNPIK